MPHALASPAVDEAGILQKEAALRHLLGGWSRVLVAFSAGVDSSYLLHVAHQELGAACTAVTADSPSLARSSLAEAEAFCRRYGIEHRRVATDEFDDPAYRANDGQRCYHCKAALFRAMGALQQASDDGDAGLLLGAVVDDFADVRPGMTAAREAGARWPLAEVGLAKEEVRVLARRAGLSCWDRPAEPCLSSRLPYGERVEPAALAMIEQAELVLRAAGFRECRARHHRIGVGDAALCRIEVPANRLAELVAQRETIEPALRDIGYAQVAVDLGGLQSGGFNALLGGSTDDA